MNWLKYKIRNWLNSTEDRIAKSNSTVHPVEVADPNDFSLNIMNALNGKVIHIRSYQPNRHGPDWKSEYYLVPEGERLSDAVTVLLMAKNLEKTQ
jgi:hypothetical protein